MTLLGKPHILVTEPEYFTLSSLQTMRRVGSVVSKRLSRKELLREVSKFEALVVRIDTQLDKKLLKRATRLKCVISATTGVNHIDTVFLQSRGIPFFSLTGIHSISTAEHAIALLFAAARKIPWAHAHMSKGDWRRWEYIGSEVTGKTLGILGIGRIGTEVAMRARALKIKVLAYDPYVSKEEVKRRGAQKADWHAFLKNSDFFSLHAPLTPATQHLFGKKEFRSMKKSATLVNTARAGIIVEKALLEALSKKYIRAAAIDVYHREPLNARHPYRRYACTHSNLILTPHLGASTHEAISQASNFAAKTLAQFFGTKI